MIKTSICSIRPHDDSGGRQRKRWGPLRCATGGSGTFGCALVTAHFKTVVVVPLLVVSVVVFGGCSNEDSGPPTPDPSCGGVAAYANPGPYPVGVTTLSISNTLVEVWYPAAEGGEVLNSYDLRDWLGAVAQQIPDGDAPRVQTRAYRGVPVAAGRHPIVVFSHGLGGYRSQSTFFTTHLASWGFVVAAPDHPERGLRLLFSPTAPVFDLAPQTMLQTVALLAEEDRRARGPFFERLDLGRVAAAGHSAGGAAAGIAAQDPAVATWIGHAGAEGGARKPALIFAGATDDTVSAGGLASIYEDLTGPSPQRFLSIAGAGHLAFSDICLIAEEQGGLISLARAYGIEIPALFAPLATDGCEVGDLAPERAWPVINHYSTAHLIEVLDLPQAGPGFDADVRACFGPLVEILEAR